MDDPNNSIATKIAGVVLLICFIALCVAATYRLVTWIVG